MKFSTILLMQILLSPIFLYSQSSYYVIFFNFVLRSSCNSYIDSTINISSSLLKELQAISNLKIISGNDLKQRYNINQDNIHDAAIKEIVINSLNAHHVFVGKVECIQNCLNINASLTNLLTGEVVDQWMVYGLRLSDIDKYIKHVSQRVDKWIENQVALEKLINFENKRSRFNVSLHSPSKTYKIGDLLTLLIEADNDCYVHVFDVGTSGQIHLLFPNRLQQDNRVLKNTTIEIKNIRVNPPTGTEMIKVIATLDNITLTELMETTQNEAVFQNLGEDIDQFARGFQAILSPLEPNRWATDTMLLDIR